MVTNKSYYLSIKFILIFMLCVRVFALEINFNVPRSSIYANLLQINGDQGEIVGRAFPDQNGNIKLALDS